MPWWSTLLICLFLSIIFVIVLLIVIKNGKKINAGAKLKDKSFNISVESDQPINTEIVNKHIQNISENFFNHYIITLIESHYLFQSGFGIIKNKSEIVYKILLKFLKKKDSIDVKNLEINLNLLHEFIQKYMDSLKSELTELFNKNIKIDNLDLTKLDKNLEDFISDVESNKLLENTILQVKSSNTILKLSSGDEVDITENSAKYYNKLFNLIEKRFKQLTPELVSDLRKSKTRIIYSENHQITSLSLVIAVYALFNSVMNFMVNVFFECKPAIVGDLEGV